MSVELDTQPHVASFADGEQSASSRFWYTTTADERGRIVHLHGELDLFTSNDAFNACFIRSEVARVVDLLELRFLDSSGYRALEAVVLVAEDLGEVLTLENATGQPARLIAILALHPEW